MSERVDINFPDCVQVGQYCASSSQLLCLKTNKVMLVLDFNDVAKDKSEDSAKDVFHGMRLKREKKSLGGRRVLLNNTYYITLSPPTL